MFRTFCLLLSLTLQVCYSKEDLLFYQKVFPTISKIEKKSVPDTISKNPINVEILIAKDNSDKVLGYIRNVTTTTGCNSECLPLIFTLFYGQDKKFKALQSKDGLTKLGHEPFSREDYFTLESIIFRNPAKLSHIKHPKELVDGITGATMSIYQKDVVKNAAYTSLRVNLYNQHTLKELKKLK